MKTSRTLTVRIHPDGRVELDTEGFVGQSCADLSRQLAALLAGRDAPDGAIEEHLKPEYYAVEDQVVEEDDLREQS
ncbi:MAG: DUF2997 domain-containing protein [Gemmatimonadales bacterium]